ncbi:2-phosphoglycolate phosphatase [Piromyces finnis]|uniref:4-nitrophenylphosphatase n=1 Tax=Piromyces finnis TaxID=1754191 RepID=A0A1Y1VKZ9_9FUNG|nr:2-phosphoglycolate phosphatase [Piromyces finnis]|eukprot:ORX59141.1 2-phosphoglycolate phosphatase [Piromyces finnis]
MSNKSFKLENINDIKRVFDSIDTFIFDCDGVIWRANNLIKGVKEALTLMKKNNKRTIFVTNNSTKTREEYFKKFSSFDLPIDINDIFSSAYSTAYYLRNVLDFPKDKRVYVLGTQGLIKEIEDVGVNAFGYEDNITEPFASEEDIFNEVKPDDSVGAVVVGFDMKVNYKKYSKAYTYITSNPDCHFLVTNSDITYPVQNFVLPEAGSVVAPLIAAVKNKEPVFLGKPTANMINCISQKFNLDLKRACMVGDRLDTDMVFGKNNNITTLLVLTGVTSEEALLNQDKIIPDYYIEGLNSFNQIQ